MVVPMEQWASQPLQDKSADLWVVMLSDHNEKYSDRMERSYKGFAVTFELRFPFPLKMINSLAPGGFDYSLKLANFKLISMINILSIFCEIAISWMPQDLTDYLSTLVQVMAWCRQATSHYMSQCWPRSLSPYDITRPQWLMIHVFCCRRHYFA